jgi:hypothetical protein
VDAVQIRIRGNDSFYKSLKSIPFVGIENHTKCLFVFLSYL